MIDIHSHIIPNIDDGAASNNEAAVMLRLAAENGTTDIIATPHYYNRWQCTQPSSKKLLKESFEKFKSFIDANNIPINLYLGSELFGVNNITELIRQNEILPLNNSRYVLIEFVFEDDFQRVRYCITQLKAGGYIPVIAHPERYEFLLSDPGNVYWFLEHDCLLQINKGSVLGKYGENARAFVRWLLDNRFVHFAASDSHSPFRRTTDMTQSYEWILSRYGEEYANTIFTENPKRILNNMQI